MKWSIFLPYLLVTAGVTYLIRMLPLTIFRREIKSRFIRSFLAYIPYAVLGAMTFPDVFYSTGDLRTAICGVAALLLLHLLLKRLYIYNKVKTTLSDIWEGVLSLRGVSDLPLYLVFSIGIWVCYFLHYYLTFFCFDFTANLGIGCALVSFVVANFAVIVPTPNGAGPWHFAIKTMLILYGVQDEQALFFVLIVHTVQTMLVILLGIWAWLRLSFTTQKQAL